MIKVSNFVHSASSSSSIKFNSEVAVSTNATPKVLVPSSLSSSFDTQTIGSHIVTDHIQISQCTRSQNSL